MPDASTARNAARALRIIDEMLDIATKATRDQWSPADSARWQAMRAKLIDIADATGPSE
jgi:hypothetical protein